MGSGCGFVGQTLTAWEPHDGRREPHVQVQRQFQLPKSRVAVAERCSLDSFIILIN